MSSQTRDLINFFQKAFQAGTMERDPEEYLAKYRSQIQAAGRVFQYLELATPDSKSVLGWKPTKRLLDLIAKSNAGRPKETPEPVEVQVLLDLVMDTILGSERRQSLVRFCIHSLIRLGLVIEDPLGDAMPTIELLDLFTCAYYARAWRGRNPNATYEAALSAAQ
jgi:hypothetical protein